DDAEYRKPRAGSFGSMHALLNHLLIGDRVWMARFEGGGQTTPPLDAILYDDLASLTAARVVEDDRIVQFFEQLAGDFFNRYLSYVNSRGQQCSVPSAGPVAHFFNHQTHHRGQ